MEAVYLFKEVKYLEVVFGGSQISEGSLFEKVEKSTRVYLVQFIIQ